MSKKVPETKAETKPEVKKAVVPMITVKSNEQVKAIGKKVQFLECSNVRLALRENAGAFQLTQAFREATKKGNQYWGREAVLGTFAVKDDALIAFIKSAHSVTSALVAGLQ